MKKIFLMTALAAGILSSCSEDDMFMQSTVDSNTIAFATKQVNGNLQTRSAVSINSIDKFTVSAVNADNTPYFNNEEYVYNVGEGVFKSQTPHYWPTTGTLSFYAISNVGAYTADANNIPTYLYQNWAAEKDLVAATVKAGEKTIPYPLNFRHLTSQIYVSAEAEDKTEELTYKVVSVKMKAPSTGTYYFADATGGVGTWYIDNSKTSEYSFDEALPRSFRQHGQIELSSTYWNILPVSDGTIHFTIEYQVYQNDRIIADLTGVKAKECVIQTPGLIAGKRYMYNFILTRSTSDEITFTTTINDWMDWESSNLNPETYVKSFAISESSTTIGIDETKTLTVSDFVPDEASHEVTWTTSNDDVATVAPATGVVTGVAVGDAVITATATDGSGIKQICTVSVVRYFPEPDGYIDSYGYIDLELPSGTRWAVTNLGSTKESSIGLYYQWGSTFGYDGFGYHNFLNSVYQYSSYASISTNLEGSNDAATQNMSANWRMPSKSEMQELLDETNHEFCTIAGVKGCKFTSKTDESKFIFLPCSGNIQGDYKPDVNWGIYYWTSTVEGAKDWNGYKAAWSLYRGDSGLKLDSTMRFYGEQIRAVAK